MNRPTSTDLTVWRRLLKRADVAARKPFGDASPFIRAADKAGRAVAPLGYQGLDSPFIQLTRAGKTFGQLATGEREATARALPDLIERCRVVLDAPAPKRLPYADR